MSKSLEKGAPPPRPNFPSATQKKWFGGGLGVKKNRFLGVWVIYETTHLKQLYFFSGFNTGPVYQLPVVKNLS